VAAPAAAAKAELLPRAGATFVPPVPFLFFQYRYAATPTSTSTTTTRTMMMMMPPSSPPPPPPDEDGGSGDGGGVVVVVAGVATVWTVVAAKTEETPLFEAALCTAN
jgi:hypothetical protein